MFRRSTKDETPSPAVTHSEKGPGAKGRPTPSRKEAEAAARERAKAVKDKKAAARLQRERRAAQNSKVREGMRTGDERYLPARDKGPVKRFVRNFIDSRISFAEFLLPLLVLIMVLQYSGSDALSDVGIFLWNATILLVALDTAWMIFRLKRAVRMKFPDESHRGVTVYAMLRVLQLRWLRMPKPQVKIGGAPVKR